MSDETSAYSRRIGSRRGDMKAANGGPRGGRIWSLRALPVVFVFPMLMALALGQPVKLLGLLGGTSLLVLAGALIRRGLDATADYEVRRYAKPPAPYRLAGALTIALAFFTIANFSTPYGLFMGIVFAGLGALVSLFTFGIDPKVAKVPDDATAERAGVRVEQVMAAIAEAEAKIGEIASAAATLRNRELQGRIDRIVDRAHAVLDEIERDPKDLSRARRFLNTYLDGTRNVIRDFARRQDDFADTPLATNFKNVLGTIEQVFTEQIDHLRKDEVLDLEVAIEVLNTQLTKEGVG